ncbi:MAG: crotonase/enoyl-CoA hydratase family protein [Leptospiraceae bacterium]|nr:crotonase/enoyl-CoA hydratase family protein [Leptospiraceae bacterium]MCP5499596.1 crotonase/enoyl-CoA hydratase family protein [Leptospiraceae bacterium]
MKTKFNFFEIVQEGNIAILYLNKPEKRNAMDWDFWSELPDAVAEINGEPSIRAFIIAARGKSFSTGLDIASFTAQFKDILHSKTADSRARLMQLILDMQKGINAVYDSNKSSIAVVHKHCIGGALDLISACDMRYCTSDASFSLREIKVAIVADMGSLNRLPAIIGQGNTRELALTGKDISSAEALRMGLVSNILPSFDEAMDYARKVANEIAENPMFVQVGVKEVMRELTTKTLEEGLRYVALWNSSYLYSHEFDVAMESFHKRKKPEYNKS